MNIDKLQMFFSHSITWGVITFVLAAIAFSGKLSLTLSNVLLVIAGIVGCVGIFRIEINFHSGIIFCLLLAIFLTAVSWWITPNSDDIKSKETIISASSYIIADCSFDIIFQISEQDLKILQASQHGVENGTIFANVDIFEKNNQGRFIQLSIMGDWYNTESRIGDSLEEMTLFSLSSKQFMFSRKKPIIGNAQSGMTKLFSNQKYNVQIRGVTTVDGKTLVLSPTSATIRTHEGIAFPAIDFKRLDGSLNEYWQSEFPSIPIRN